MSCLSSHTCLGAPYRVLIYSLLPFAIIRVVITLPLRAAIELSVPLPRPACKDKQKTETRPTNGRSKNKRGSRGRCIQALRPLDKCKLQRKWLRLCGTVVTSKDAMASQVGLCRKTVHRTRYKQSVKNKKTEKRIKGNKKKTTKDEYYCWQQSIGTNCLPDNNDCADNQLPGCRNRCKCE